MHKSHHGLTKYNLCLVSYTIPIHFPSSLRIFPQVRYLEVSDPVKLFWLWRDSPLLRALPAFWHSLSSRAKVIWETLSRFKEAPADVERLIMVVGSLGFLLEQLENLWKRNDRDEGTLSKDLEVVIGTCAFDLDRFHKQISRSQASRDKKT